MTSLATEITWDTHEDAMRTALKVPSGDDDDLEALLLAGIVAGDDYIGRDFVDADGNDIALPKNVIKGLWAWCKSVRASDDVPPAGVTKIKTSSLEETYSGEGIDPMAAAIKVAAIYWFPYVLDPWRV